MSSLLKQLEDLRQNFLQAYAHVEADPSSAGVEALRVHWLGRKGQVTGLFDHLKSATPEERPLLGKNLNLLRDEVEKKIEALRDHAIAADIEKQLNAPPVDISLPPHPHATSKGLHPVSLMWKRLVDIFRRYGFVIYDGPEIEYDFYNFSALNFPENHPCRDMQDTFFVKEQPGLVLRTHTSNIQIHALLHEKPPLRLVAPGRVFRCDNDATHTPMFHQIECVVVDRGISMAHLKGMIDAFMKEIFGRTCVTRFRPSFFPFVEPGAEVDLQCTMCTGKGCRICKQTGWLEIGGCGMIHPNVFEAVHYDSEEYTGFAFGFGIDRMAMLAWQLGDLRQMFEGDSQYSNQFPLAVWEIAQPSGA